MKISKQAQRDARQLFRSCVNNGVLDEARVRQTILDNYGSQQRLFVLTNREVRAFIIRITDSHMSKGDLFVLQLPVLFGVFTENSQN